MGYFPYRYAGHSRRPNLCASLLCGDTPHYAGSAALPGLRLVEALIAVLLARVPHGLGYDLRHLGETEPVVFKPVRVDRNHVVSHPGPVSEIAVLASPAEEPGHGYRAQVGVGDPRRRSESRTAGPCCASCCCRPGCGAGGAFCPDQCYVRYRCAIPAQAVGQARSVPAPSIGAWSAWVANRGPNRRIGHIRGCSGRSRRRFGRTCGRGPP